MKKLILDGDYVKDIPRIENIAITYSQDPDCEQNDTEVQVIKFETVSNGIASFFRMSLPQGGYWSFCNEEELLNIFRDFRSRFEQKEQ
jgi:hypothetical protein